MDLMIMGALSWWKSALALIFTIVCIVLIVIVLLQKGRGGGLSAAFGGSGGHSAFGSKTGDVFTWATIVVVGVFLLLAMILTSVYKPDSGSDLIGTGDTQQAQPVPGATGTTGTTSTTDTTDTTGTAGLPTGVLPPTGSTGVTPPTTPPVTNPPTGTTGER